MSKNVIDEKGTEKQERSEPQEKSKQSPSQNKFIVTTQVS